MTYSEFKKAAAGARFKSGNGRILYDPADIEVYKRPKNNILFARDRRSKFIDGFWRVKPVATWGGQVLIVCPLCGQVHYHGAEKDGTGYEGFRLCHCIGSAYRDENHNTYEIVTA